MHTSILSKWIADEIALEQSEGASESADPATQACVFINVLASHVDEFLADRNLVIALREMFRSRGLTGKVFFTTLFGLGLEMNQEQLPILGWLMENENRTAGDKILWASEIAGNEPN